MKKYKLRASTSLKGVLECGFITIHLNKSFGLILLY